MRYVGVVSLRILVVYVRLRVLLLDGSVNCMLTLVVGCFIVCECWFRLLV